jgi:hypothetical protein
MWTPIIALILNNGDVEKSVEYILAWDESRCENCDNMQRDRRVWNGEITWDKIEASIELKQEN